jgi:hypothetical protein
MTTGLFVTQNTDFPRLSLLFFWLLYCTTSLLYRQSIVPPIYCTTNLLYHQSIVPPVYCTTSLLYHQSIVPPIYCTTNLLYHQSIVPPIYCTTSLLQTISTLNLLTFKTPNNLTARGQMCFHLRQKVRSLLPWFAQNSHIFSRITRRCLIPDFAHIRQNMWKVQIQIYLSSQAQYNLYCAEFYENHSVLVQFCAHLF